jgi:hypothetical protein
MRDLRDMNKPTLYAERFGLFDGYIPATSDILF